MKIILILMLSVSICIQAKDYPNFVITTGIKQDVQGNLVQPDKYHLSLGLKQHNEGYYYLAFMYFKKSAALGNAMASRLVGLMYVNGLGVSKDMIKGYAWLKLASHDKTKRSLKLEKQVRKILDSNQLRLAHIEYEQVNENYGTIASLTRRDRWVHKQKMKMTGTRTGSLVFAPLYYNSPHGNGIYDQIQSYVNDYNFGYVTSGKIIPKETKKSGEQ